MVGDDEQTLRGLVLGPAADLWDEVAAIRAALEASARCRQAAALRLYAELTAEEAATVLGISASTVHTRTALGPPLPATTLPHRSLSRW